MDSQDDDATKESSERAPTLDYILPQKEMVWHLHMLR